MTQSFGKSMSTAGSNHLQQKASPNPSSVGGTPPASAPQENLETRSLFQHIGLPPMAKTVAPPGSEDIFAPPQDGKLEDVSTSSPSITSVASTAGPSTSDASPSVASTSGVSTSSPSVSGPSTSSPSSLFKQPEAATLKEEKRYDIPFLQQEKDILCHLSDFTKSQEFKPFQNPRSRRSLTNNDGATVLEELAQDFSTRNLTTRKDGSSEQVRDRLGRIVYEKFQEGEKWTARFLYYHDQAGKKSPFVHSLKSLSSDGRFREVQYSKLGQIESEKETLYDLKMAL